MSEREKLTYSSAVSLIVIFFLSSVGSVLFSALSIGLAGVAVHGALRVPDDLFIDDAAQGDGSMLGFLLGKSAASTAGIAGV